MKNSKGFTTVELLVSIVIASTVILGMYSVYANVYKNNHSIKNISDSNTFIKKLHDLVSVNNGFDNNEVILPCGELVFDNNQLLCGSIPLGDVTSYHAEFVSSDNDIIDIVDIPLESFSSYVPNMTYLYNGITGRTHNEICYQLANNQNKILSSLSSNGNTITCQYEDTTFYEAVVSLESCIMYECSDISYRFDNEFTHRNDELLKITVNDVTMYFNNIRAINYNDMDIDFIKYGYRL